MAFVETLRLLDATLPRLDARTLKLYSAKGGALAADETYMEFNRQLLAAHHALFMGIADSEVKLALDITGFVRLAAIHNALRQCYLTAMQSHDDAAKIVQVAGDQFDRLCTALGLEDADHLAHTSLGQRLTRLLAGE